MFFLVFRIRYMALCIPKHPPNVTSFLSFISHCTKIPHTHTTETFNECYFLIFISFASKELLLIPWATEITLHFFLVVFHYFSFSFLYIISFFLLLYFIILTELLLASIKLPIFFCSISFLWRLEEEKNYGGWLTKKLYFSMFE